MSTEVSALDAARRRYGRLAAIATEAGTSRVTVYAHFPTRGEAARSGRIDSRALVLVNVTGGGAARLAADHPLIQAEPRLRLSRAAVASGEAAALVTMLF
jgi:AcrR family transcriptional regulator